MYIHSKPDGTVPVDFLSQCIYKIKELMLQKFLCLNSEIMLIGSPHQLRKAGTVHFIVDDSIMEFEKKIKKSVIFDSNLTREPHLQNTV